MRCDDYLDLLQRRFDGESIDSAAFDQHTADCASCRQWAQSAQTLQHGLSRLPRPVATAQLNARIVAAVLADQHKPRVPTIRPMWAAAALAASILVLAVGINTWFPSRVPHPTRVAKKPATNKEAIVKGDSPSLRKTVADAGEAVTQLTASLAGETRKQAELIWHATGPIDFTPLPDLTPKRLGDPLSPAAESLRDTGKGVSEGFVTVAKSAQKAVNYFVRGFTN